MRFVAGDGLGGIAAMLLALMLLAPPQGAAQSASPAATPPNSASTAVTGAKALAGAVLGLASHESGHMVLDLSFKANPGIRKVSFAGIPFFAITHDTVSDGREFAISAVGFWMQHASSEVLLIRRPNLRHERAPVAKGVLAFNTLTSVIYAGAAVARTGPNERDTRGMAVTARIAEPWIAPVILGPAALDAARYFKPDSRVLRWSSRAAKLGGLLLMARAVGH